MGAWFRFNGTLSTDYGVYVGEFPPVTIAEEAVEFVHVPGRSGDLTVTEGEDVYNDIVLTVKCVMKDLNHLGDICRWLRGAGGLELGNRPGFYYEARVVNQIGFEKFARGRLNRNVAINFRCKPFLRMLDEPTLTLTGSQGELFTIGGHIPARPRFEITYRGDYAETGAKASFVNIYHVPQSLGFRQFGITDTRGGVVLDLEKSLCYKIDTGEPAWGLLTGDWDVAIDAGTRLIGTWSVDQTETIIIPQGRWLA